MNTQLGRKHCKYLGIERYTRSPRTGKLVPRATNNFTRHHGTLNDRVAIRAAADAAVVWTRKDQAQAVERGVFVRRLQKTGRACIESLYIEGLHCGTEAELFDQFWAELVADPDSRFLRKLFVFLKQQDQYGWSDTWESSCIEQRGSNMGWLRTMTDDRRVFEPKQLERTHKEQIRFHLMADRDRKFREANGGAMRPMRRVYIPGCTCSVCSKREAA